VKKTLAALLCAASVVALEAAKIKVKAEPDPTYDFSTVRTWAWDAEGDVIMARTPTDDPVALKARLDPLIRKYVAAEMAKRGLAAATATPPDVHLHYYVLVTVASSGQEMGQFLPAVPYWGLPPFAPATQSLNIVTRGSLVLDAMQPGLVGDRKVVWRGIAESTVEEGTTDAKREERIREASAELVKRFPLKKKT